VLVIDAGGKQTYLFRKVLTALNKTGCSVVRLTESPEELWNLSLVNPDIVILDKTVSGSLEFWRQYTRYNIPVILVDKNASEKVLRPEGSGLISQSAGPKHKRIRRLISMIEDILHC